MKQSFEQKFIKVLAAQDLAISSRLRTLIGKERELIEEGNVYGEKKSEAEFDALMDEVVNTEFIRHLILGAVKDEPLSVKEVSKVLRFPSEIILKHVLKLKQKGALVMTGIEGRSPVYRTSALTELAGAGEPPEPGSYEEVVK